MKLLKISLIAALLVASATVMADQPLETQTLRDIRQINVTGFGTDANRYAFAMATFKDSLYVGTLNIKSMAGMFNFLTATSGKRVTEGAEIWRYDMDGTWTRVVEAGLGNRLNMGVRKMVAIGDYLYGVTANHDTGMEVWRTADGTNWEAVVTGGFGDVTNTSGRGLGEFDGYIYVGCENRKKGAELWRSTDGKDWEKVADKGLGDKRNVWMSDFALFNGYLYTGTLNITRGMQCYRSKDGKNFEQVFKGGLDKKTNMAGMKLIVYKDHLYISTMDFIRGFDLYRTADGTNFERILSKGFINRHQAYLWQMEVYAGRLYAGTYDHSDFTLPRGTFKLLSTDNGTDWIIENDNAFGSRKGYYGIRSMAVFNDKLIIGSASARFGCKVFEASMK